MIAWITRRPFVAALAALAVLLLVAIGVEAEFASRLGRADGSAPAKASAAPEAKLLPPVIAQAAEQAYPETAARPLFTPTRRLAPVEPSGGKPAFARGQFVLQGVIVVGDQRTALLREKASGRIHRVDRGKDLNGILVESIEPTEVTLASGGERERIALVVQRPEGAAKVAATAAEPAQGPFGAAAHAATPAPAAGAAAPASPTANPARVPTGANPAARTTATNTAPTGAPSTTQPMSPEELLARRRARRNQPTQ